MPAEDPMGIRVPDGELRAWIERIADELCLTVNGQFDHLVRVEVNDDSLEKLQMLVNFVLDHARRAAEARQEADRLVRENLSLARQVGTYRELGHYRLEEIIGSGGMGEVWRGRHRMLARPAAVKLIRREALGIHNPDRTISRFQREARATAKLRSPHTIAVYDFGVHENDFYYVMELLEGVDLHTLIQEDGVQPPERVAYILEQACHSLEEAHRAGLVHRDIKPGNLHLCQYGIDYDFVKVLDFGLVKSFQDSTEPHLTEDGSFAGTPAFLAPESILGKRPVDGRADLYALGHTAYLMLAGRQCFESSTPFGAAMKQVNEMPVPLSAHPGVKIPEALEKLVMSCLEKDPDRRPPSAGDLARELRHSKLAEAWTEDRQRAWWERWWLRHGGRKPESDDSNVADELLNP